jgi:putative transposase
LLAQAMEAEVAEALAAHAHLTTNKCHQRLVRHGHMPERRVQTGIGPVRQPGVRDRDAADGERIRFSSSLSPRYARRTRSPDALLPMLYLRGISASDTQEAVAALLGKDAPNLSPAVRVRLKAGWQEDYECWKRRDLSARRYVYIWADGVYLQARMEPDKQCILVLIGATPEGRKELIGFQVGFRESAQSLRELLADLKAREAWPCHRNWPSATARFGSGRRWKRSSAPPSNAAGSTRL